MQKNILIKSVITLAEELVRTQKTTQKDAFAKRMSPIIHYPKAKTFLIKLMDTSFRSAKTKRIARYIKKLTSGAGNHKIVFNPLERVLIGIFEKIGHLFPQISIPVMLQQIKASTQAVVFFTGSKRFNNHVIKRSKNKITLNVNLIGESLIGEDEAKVRIEKYKQLLRQPNVSYISIKISTIFSQLNALAFDDCVAEIVKRLSILYREVQQIEKNTGVTKFINLDMEEYRDLQMTVAAFKNTLDRDEFKSLRMGIVLQAYLPDSYEVLLDLQKWAEARVAKGGSPIKVRLVKGANLEMELTEASMEHWELVTYRTKIDTDANYKRMLLQMLKKQYAHALHIGVASHNIFDLALAMVVSKNEGVAKFVDIEMLEGMANELVNVIISKGVSLLLYTPIVSSEQYNNAIAYLVRRLDESTQPGNFLKEGFGLKVNSQEWKFLKNQFETAFSLMEQCPKKPFRKQDRNTEKPILQTHFYNVANTDWVLPQNRKWIQGVKKRWETPEKIIGSKIPVVAAPLEKKQRPLTNPPAWHKISWAYELADANDYQKVIDEKSIWQGWSVDKRATTLKKAAVLMEEKRGDLIAVAVTELGKTIAEVDVEVSEAIDFANYYAQNIIDFEKGNIRYKNKGIHLVLSPWNFPIAIPIGGVLASLAAGKRVILKPSTNAAAAAYLVSQCLWEAGVPKEDFAFLPAEESNLDRFLIDPDIFDAVILTGSTETAQFLLNRCPRLKLYAETGGKNATIVTALSDREQAIKNVVWSAFGNAGQKCSATSLLILERELFENTAFKNLLRDATKSKDWGNPWDFKTFIGPLAVPMNDVLKSVIERTPDEKWLLKPTVKDDFFVSPGIIWGVTKDDEVYQKELFAPILAVMCANDLNEAISLVNGTDYGLTSGIESLDPDEINHWKNHIKAGNLYANRSTTGAIVLRQPFGGMKASCFGFGMKAGGMNYVAQFLMLTEPEKDLASIKKSYHTAYKTIFSKRVDNANIRGQYNENIYLKPKKIAVLIDAQTPEKNIEKVRIATEILGVATQFYGLEKHPKIPVKILSDWCDLTKEINFEVCIRALNYERLNNKFLLNCHQKSVHIYGRVPSNDGRFELLNYLTEQSQSINYHRYGNLMGVDYKS